MRFMTLVSTLMFCLILASGVFAGERQVTVTRIDQEVQTLPEARGAAGDCLMGNLNAPYYAISGWLLGMESYSYVYEADAAACACPEGFAVETVHIYLQFAGAMDFDVAVGLSEAEWDFAGSCWVPGADICASPVYNVAIPGGGLYDIALPVTCDCAFFGYHYAIDVDFLTSFAVSPDMITDNVPVGCVSWNDYGGGWVDLNPTGFPGELLIFADVACCADPVANEDETFGGIKSLFR
jgi:hypothetical protein